MSFGCLTGAAWLLPVTSAFAAAPIAITCTGNGSLLRATFISGTTTFADLKESVRFTVRGDYHGVTLSLQVVLKRQYKSGFVLGDQDLLHDVVQRLRTLLRSDVSRRLASGSLTFAGGKLLAAENFRPMA